jgi:hypothetical protein
MRTSLRVKLPLIGLLPPQMRGLLGSPFHGRVISFQLRYAGAGVERTVWRLDPDQAVSGAKTMEHIIQLATLDRRFEAQAAYRWSASLWAF